MTKALSPAEAVALDCMRYRQHMLARAQAQAQVVDTETRLSNIKTQVAGLEQEREYCRHQLLLWSAEAREQRQILIDRHGLSEEEVDALFPVQGQWQQVFPDVSSQAPARFSAGKKEDQRPGPDGHSGHELSGLLREIEKQTRTLQTNPSAADASRKKGKTDGS